MNFDEAIRAHSDWKIKLQQYVRNPDGSIDPEVLCKDDQCTLGQWIYGEGKRYATISDYADLKIAHQHFHESAADIVRRCGQGENLSSEMVLGAKTPFGENSKDVVKLLIQLKMKVGQAA